ncbi:MAG: DUF5671 domain-containing protein [Patescibacteria group bacterium]
MDKPKATPKDFFLWAGAMVALYAGVFSFVGLLFDYINYVFPDTALQNYYYGNPYQGSISYEMASLIVLAPVLLILMRVIRAAIQKDPSRREIWVRRWALFLTLFVAGATIVIDLIVLINTFLQGEDLSVRFLLKVAVVLLVAAAGFMHFTADLWGYWERKPQYARMVSWAVALLVVLTILSGFLIIGSPQSQRAYRIDEQRVGDLTQIQSQIVYSYYQPKQKLPASLDALSDPISGWVLPKDPESGAAYEYRATGTLSFELCATFTHESRSVQQGGLTPRPATVYMGGMKGDNWQHGAGRTCFERVIDPQLYPATPSGK